MDDKKPAGSPEMHSFDRVARHFGYEPGTLRELIREGKFPRPRGMGKQLYYTTEDIGAIVLMLGRWLPEDSRKTGGEQ